MPRARPTSLPPRNPAPPHGDHGTAQRTSVPQRLSANGNVAAWQEASVGAESNDLRLTAVNVNVGDVVKAGQVLATFAADTVQADVAQARASVMEAGPTPPKPPPTPSARGACKPRAP